jgi:hypothetical protein
VNSGPFERAAVWVWLMANGKWKMENER